MRAKRTWWLLAVACTVGGVWADNVGSVTIHVDQPGVKISPVLYGLMTEEINHSYDGGLYAELLQNRDFKFRSRGKDAVPHWTPVAGGAAQGTLTRDTDHPDGPGFTHSLRLDATAVAAGERFGAANDGYWGVPVQPNTTYTATLYAKPGAGFTGPLELSLESQGGAAVHASATLATLAPGWQRYSVTLKTAATATASTANRFVVSTSKAGSVSLGLVSLFPPTYKDRPNGLRVDLMKLMDGMRPTFLRFPGGNYLEGNTVAERFDWKKTLGDVSQRPGHPCCWGYPSTDGMGLLEFLYWCEDLRMEPVLAVFAGYALRGEYVKPGPALEPFVQEALEEIEFVSGDVTTKWGAERARLGHPAPFALRYVEIGNEDWFDKSRSYDGRFAQFFDAIRAKYPKLQLIATAAVKSRTPDLMDDHYYRSARAMAGDSHHYDRTPRGGTKIFVGEWASMEGSPTPNLQAALGDAAWLTGLERNSDVVVMQCYAPLLVNVNPGGRQWRTNLIGYDALRSFGSPSYWVQSMFGQQPGDTVLPVELGQPTLGPTADKPTLRGGIGVGTWATSAEFKDLKVADGDKVLYQADLSGTQGWRLGAGQWQAGDGVLRQTGTDNDCRATAGDAGWGDYTYSLKARKVSGAEGFLVMFHHRDGGNWLWWNVGGWGNSRSALEQMRDGGKHELGASVPMTLETGRWYDVRIELKGHTIRCFLDNKLITEASDAAPGQFGPLFATSSRVDASGEVIVKLVNFGEQPQRLNVELAGVREAGPTGTAWVLSGQPADVNSVDEPEKVAPRKLTLNVAGPKFAYDAPGWSVSVLRLPAR